MMKSLLGIKVLLLAMLLLSTSCDKNEDDAKPTTPNADLTVHENVQVIDSTAYKLDLNPQLLEAGTYRFTATGTPLDVAQGAVIVGEQGMGFMRRVTGVTVQGNQTTLQTEQASLEDIFSSGTLTIESSSADLIEGGRKADDGFSYTVSNHPIYQDGALSLSLKSGAISMNPNWKIEADFGPDGTINAEVATQDATLHGNFVFNVTAAKAVTLPERISTLKHYYKDLFVKVPIVILGVPVKMTVKVRMNIDLNLHYGATVNAAISREATFDSKTTFSVGAAYKNAQWQGMYSLTPVNTFTLGAPSGKANATVNMALVPKISFMVLGAVGPYASVGLQEKLQVAAASPALDWNLQADAWLKTTIGVTGSFFGKNLPDYSQSWETEKLTYKSPASMVRVAGDNQTGAVNRALATPVKVRVLDSAGKPESGVPVYFTPAAGNGSAAPVSILTDAEGYAQATWTLGASSQQQHLQVTAKTAAGVAIENAPLGFAATPVIVPHSVSIQDGNNQLGDAQKKLSKPLQVIVKDAAGAVLEGVDVEWKVKAGGGTLTAAKSKTNAAGIAQVEWTLGSSGTQEVEAIVKKSDGTLVNGAPATFSASIGSILGKWTIISRFFEDNTTPGNTQTGYPGDNFDFRIDGALIITKYDQEDKIWEVDEYAYVLEKSKMELAITAESGGETDVDTYKILTFTNTDFVIECKEVYSSGTYVTIKYTLRR